MIKNTAHDVVMPRCFLSGWGSAIFCIRIQKLKEIVIIWEHFLMTCILAVPALAKLQRIFGYINLHFTIYYNSNKLLFKLQLDMCDHDLTN